MRIARILCFTVGWGSQLLAGLWALSSFLNGHLKSVLVAISLMLTFHQAMRQIEDQREQSEREQLRQSQEAAFIRWGDNTSGPNSGQIEGSADQCSNLNKR
jgi:hypothetical protein